MLHASYYYSIVDNQTRSLLGLSLQSRHLSVNYIAQYTYHVIFLHIALMGSLQGTLTPVTSDYLLLYPTFNVAVDSR